MLPPLFALATLSACGVPLAATRSCEWEIALARWNAQCTMFPCDLDYTRTKLSECLVRVTDEYNDVLSTTRMLAHMELKESYNAALRGVHRPDEAHVIEIGPEVWNFLCLVVFLSYANCVWDGYRHHKRRVTCTDALCARGECCICLAPIAKGQRIADFSCCRQVFHARCIKEWFEHNNTCPVCRRTERYELK